MGNVIYEVKDLKSGQCAKGTAADLSILVGVEKSRVSKLARENTTYQKRYKFQMLSEENEKQKTKKDLEQEFVEICKIYAELKEGKRKIQRVADGKLYAVRKDV